MEKGKAVLIPLKIAQRLLGDGVRYESGTGSIILTTETKVLHFKTDSLDATMNRKPFELTFAAKKSESGEVYLPFAPLKELFGIRADVGATSGIVTLRVPDQSLQHAVVPEESKGTPLRAGPGRSHPIVEDLKAGTDLTLVSEEDHWYKAQSAEGFIGYVDPSDVTLTSIEKVPNAAEVSGEEPFVAWKLTGKRINLTWVVNTANPDAGSNGDLTGVNVVSPTWF